MIGFAIMRVLSIYTTKPMEFQTHFEKMTNQTLNLSQFNLGFGFPIDEQYG